MQVDLDRMQAVLEKAALIVINDPGFGVIFDVLDKTVQANERQDPVSRARVLVARR